MIFEPLNFVDREMIDVKKFTWAVVPKRCTDDILVIMHTKIENLTVGMLGTEGDPECRLYGAQTNGMLQFAHDVLLPKFGHKIGRKLPDYQAAVSSLVRMLGVIRRHRRVVPTQGIQQFCDDVTTHIRALQRLGIPYKPKHHIMMEMAVRLRLR